jgi:hypothetical protein
MAGKFEFTIGTAVQCEDEGCGVLRRIVVNPVSRTLTHLVVEPPRAPGSRRLVPVGLVESAGTKANANADIRLRCGIADFEALEYAEETQFLEGARGDWPYEQASILSWPYFGLPTGNTSGVAVAFPPDSAAVPETVTTERVPPGKVTVRRGEPVHATDGAIGRVQGLIVDPADQHVTHVLLDEGHLWGKKRIAIPIGAVTDASTGVHLSLTKDEVRDLPAVDLDGD